MQRQSLRKYRLRYLNISDLINISDSKLNDEEFTDSDEFEPLGPPSSRSSDFENVEAPGADLEFSPSEEASIDRSNEAAYQDFVNADDGIELEGPETITTEG